MKKFLLFIITLCTLLDSAAQIKYTGKNSVSGNVTDITHAGDGSQRIFVASKSGTITILDAGYNTLGTLLNISTLIATDSEKGLLGLAFHPDFETNGYFFVNYNPSGTNHTVIARFTAATPSANATVNNNTQKTILTITEAANTNHKSGDLAFGPDGYLYVPTGDGGGTGDPQMSGQNGNTFLGKILRLDINTTSPYLVPATNPFVSNSDGILNEIWDMGLRNPWRISFDKQTNDLWIADVGQGAKEEINFEAPGAGGKNYGWRCREGKIAYNGCTTPASNFTEPIFDYSRCGSPCVAGTGNSITGGFVYRGTVAANSSMVGYYIFADYVSKHAWMIKYTSGSLTDTKTISNLTTSGITTFGELENGEIMAGLSSGGVGLIESTECTQSPTISLSSIASSYPRGSSFTINTTVNDPDGTVTKVDFYNNNVFFGTDNTSPFSYSISPATAVSYSITGKVFDNCNLMTTSSALTITTTVSCSDGYQNGNETGVDCGGSCSACGTGCSTAVNLSQGKSASQSSTYNAAYAASKLVDGIGNNFNHTNAELQPWWQVDLGSAYLVSSLEITNRPDCCGDRIKRFRVFVSNSASIGGYSSGGSVYQYDNPTGMTNGQVLNIPNINTSGRYVRIWVDNTGYANNPIHLAEVKVMGCSGVDPCLSNQNPTISINTNASSYPQGSSFTVNATANDAGGTVTLVEFYNGVNLMGTDNSSPFSYTISPASASSYNITAKAIDDCNASTTSNALSITTTTSCSDGFQNGNETGVDCGGSCGACSAGCSTSVNISQGKSTSQSSTYSAAYASSKLVDGIGNNFNHTNAELQPWWQVDLGSAYLISSLEITNRPDCCGDRIKRFRVFVSNSASIGGYSSGGSVYQYDNPTGMTNGQVLNIPGINSTGRYVRIWVDNTGYANNPIHLAEVKVMGCSGVDPCLSNQNPTISITSNASSYPQGSSFTVNATANDVGGTVSRVDFYNGVDLMGSDNVSPFSYTVSPASAGPYNITAKAIDDCNASTTSNALSITTTTSCSDGFQNGNETGVDCGGSCSACSAGCSTSVNISQGKSASQSSTYTSAYAASKLVDGIGNNFNHTNAELQPWWQVNLGSAYLVSSLEITNRGDCCGNRIKRFKVFISNSSTVAGYATGGSVYQYDNPSGMTNGQVLTIPNVNVTGQYVRIWVDNTGYGNNPIHLAEVKVMGCATSSALAGNESNPQPIPFLPSAHINEIRLFPNPTHDLIYFQFESRTESNVIVNIYDLQGRLVQAEKLTGNQVDIARLESGSYIVHIVWNGNRYIHKVIKI